MGILGTKKKKKGSEVEETEEHEPVAEAARTEGRKKIKPNERLDSVMSESVVSSALQLLRENDRFQLSPEAWVVLVVSSDALGGLGKKHSSNEAKGSIIEHIEQDQIQVLATAQMLNEEHFGIIPTLETLAVMDEYSLLTKAGYYWSLVQVDDDGGLLVEPMAEGGAYINAANEGSGSEDGGYKEALAVAEGTVHIGDVLPELWEWAADDRGEEVAAPAPEPYEEGPTGVFPAVPAEDEDEDEDPMSGAAGPIPAEDEGVDYSQMNDEADDASEDEDEGSLEDEFVPAVPTQVEPTADPDEDHDDDEGADEEYLNYLEENEGRVVKAEEVQETIARRFLSDELNLEVSLDEFNTMFDVDAPTIEFPATKDATDWLGSQVNQMVRQANTELDRLHKDHADELRETFVNLMSQHTEAVLDQVSLKKGDTIYVQMNAAADAEYDQATKSVDDQAALQRRELNERFEAQAEQRAQQAAANARVEFQNRNRPQHEQNLAEIGTALQRRAEERREYRRQDTLKWRGAEARKLMDLGTNKALQMLSERQAEQREVEMEMMRSWSDEMTRVIDANRKNDMVRANTLATQLEKDTRVEELRSEQAARVAEITAEREAAIQRLNNEIAQHHVEAQRKLTTREAELQGLIESERSRAAAAQVTINSLTKQMDKADGRVSKEFKDNIKQLEKSNDAKTAELERQYQANRRNLTFLGIVALVFCFMVGGVGLVLGWAVSASSAEPAPMPVPVVEQQQPAPAAPAD